MTALRFTLNGKPRTVTGISPTTTVLDWLRLEARLTGTKEGCAEGDCGACTIAISPLHGVVSPLHVKEPRWQAVNSCLMLLPQLDGYDVLTVEGLSPPDGPLHPIQQAMIDADATQCGFCTPGFVMAMFAFREGGEAADDATIHEALAGNLCRCTGYRAIVEACRRVAGTGEGTVHSRTTQQRGGGAPQSLAYRYEAQRFYAPTSLVELLSLRAEYTDAILLAGGTDLGLRVSKEKERLPLVISTAGVAELRESAVSAETLTLGGAVTYTEALPHLDAHFPAFAALVRRIGSRQIRNLGTLAGNLATASPIGDTLPVLIALGAGVTLASRTGARTLAVENFITGYRQTALAEDEVIHAIHLPLIAAGETLAAYKVSKRFDQDISTVVAAFYLKLERGKLAHFRAAFGGMAAKVQRASALERALAGQSWTQESLAGIDRLLAEDFSPLGDHRGSAIYRLRAAAGLVRRLQIETASPDVRTRVEAL